MTCILKSFFYSRPICLCLLPWLAKTELLNPYVDWWPFAAILDLSKVNWFLFIGGGRPSRRQYKCRSVVSHGPNKRGVARPTSAHCSTQWCMSRNAKNQPKKSICKNFKGLLFQVTANINPKLIAKHFWTKENIKSCFVQIWKIFHLNADWRFHIWEIWWPKCPILFILRAGWFFRFFGLIKNVRLWNFFLWIQFTHNPGPVNMIFLRMKNLFLSIRKVQKQITSVDLFGPKS